MHISRMIAMGLVVAVAALTGCKNSVKQENAMLKSELADLQQQLADRNAALEACNQDLRSRDLQLAQLRRDMEEGRTGNTGFENIPGVSGQISAGEVTAVVEGDLLFDSGKATLKASAKKSLDAVANVLNSSYAGKTVRIAGHTDTDPIRKSGHKSNYHLGFERAFAVREYLISKGIAPNRLHIASYGPDVPKSSKSESRRVEIVVVMNPDEMTAAANTN